jgi:hypothetical protein
VKEPKVGSSESVKAQKSPSGPIYLQPHYLRVPLLCEMFFFGATGGMIGVAAQAGRLWTSVTGVIFLTMAALAFIQRAMTGL